MKANVRVQNLQVLHSQMRNWNRLPTTSRSLPVNQHLPVCVRPKICDVKNKQISISLMLGVRFELVGVKWMLAHYKDGLFSSGF